MSGEGERWRRLSAVFAAALERGPEERPGYLTAACGGDAALRGEVESLLAAHERAGEFLEPPAAGFASDVATAGYGGPAEGRALLAADSRLGPYEIVALVGAGGMGEVYRARDPRLGREVAIKVLLRAVPAAADLQRFSQEARTAGALNHPNLLAVYDVGAEAGRPFVVTELLEGETLRERLRHGPLPLAQALDAARQVLAGLEAAHEKGIVHRDLKPENLFLTADGRVKVLDFGLAKQDAGGGESFPTLTRTGLVLGTVGYTAPEQLRGHPADARSDLFAFGAVLYEMLAGRRAFTGASAVAAMSATLLDEPPPLAGERPEVPAGLERLVRRCLAKAPEERFGSAREVRWALEALAAPSAAARPTEGAPAAAAERSIAVLPFVNMSPDPGQEYFCEGLAEELIHALGQLAGLRVAGRSSSFFFKGRPDAVRRIGEELRVESVLEGSVRRAGERLRITVQLVNAADGYHLWSDRYDLAMEDVFAVQDEITARVVEALRLRLADPRQARRRATPDLEAYHLYLRGRYHWNKRHEGALLAGVRDFEQAIEKDPLYAPAWAGLADSYALLPSYTLARPAEAMPRAKAAALKALEIDDRLPDPHAALGWVAMHYEWDWQAAESHFRRAIELGPGRATTRHWYSFLLSALARSEEALLQAQKGAELDPLSLIVLVNLAQPLYFARRHAEVIAQSRRVVEMDPSFPVGHLWLGLGYAGEGRYAEAAAAQEAFAAAYERSPRGLGLLGHAKALAGEREEARGLLAELARRSEAGEAAAYYAAVVALALGERDAALGWLERSLEERADQLPYLAVEPLLDPLRGDPRFAALLRRLRLETAARLATPAPPAAPAVPPAEAPPPARGRAVAVLPFRELSAEPGAEAAGGQLGLALADATITELAHLKALLVRPTSAILGYQRESVDPQQAGRELAVDAVVDGTLQRAGERLRVSVRLVGTADGGCLWGETMEVGLDDLFRVQDEVSRQIARALAVELGAGEERRRAGRTRWGREAGRAYEHYLRGKAQLYREGLSDFVAAIDWFERARDADPEFAPAWAGLAEAYSHIAFTYHPEGDWYGRAEAMCARALELDPNLPEGRYVRARLRWNPRGGWDHGGVLRDLWAAVAARPNLEEAFVLMGAVLYHVGLVEEAIAQIERALAISPQHARAAAHKAFCLYHLGRYEEAAASTAAVVGLDPAPWVHYQAALCQIRLGDLDGAAANAARMSRGFPIQAVVAAVRGDAAEADRQIRLTEENRAFGDYHHAQYEVGTAQAQLGRTEPAIEWLAAAAGNGYPCTPLFEIDPLLDPLRGDPAFGRLLADLRAGTAAYAALWAELQGSGSAAPSPA